jgi:hypothetical protein
VKYVIPTTGKLSQFVPFAIIQPANDTLLQTLFLTLAQPIIISQQFQVVPIGSIVQKMVEIAPVPVEAVEQPHMVQGRINQQMVVYIALQRLEKKVLQRYEKHQQMSDNTRPSKISRNPINPFTINSDQFRPQNSIFLVNLQARKIPKSDNFRNEAKRVDSEQEVKEESADEGLLQVGGSVLGEELENADVEQEAREEPDFHFADCVLEASLGVLEEVSHGRNVGQIEAWDFLVVVVVT